MLPEIYRDVVPKKNLLELLQLLEKYNESKVDGGNWMPVTDENISYSYFDNNNEASKVKKIYQQFSFGLWGNDNEVNERIKNLLYPLQVLHANVNNYHLGKNSSTMPSSGSCCRYTLNHIPVGGGYIDPHTDDKNEDHQLQTLLYITEKPKYYSQGELLVKTPKVLFSDNVLNPTSSNPDRRSP